MLKYLFLIFLIIAFVAPVRRFLFWLIVGRQLTKEQKRYNDAMHKKQKPKRSGEINVDYVPDDAKKPGYRGGEYIDYEEVKD